MSPIGISNIGLDLGVVAYANMERYEQKVAGKNLSDEAAKKVALDFESIFLHRLLDAMKKTIPESGLLETGITKQFQDMFWFHMAEEMADQGGMGIGEMIYKQIKQLTGGDEVVSSLETEQ